MVQIFAFVSVDATYLVMSDTRTGGFEHLRLIRCTLATNVSVMFHIHSMMSNTAGLHVPESSIKAHVNIIIRIITRFSVA